MWVLESSGDFFQGRRIWLKPGKSYLFGRTKRDDVAYALDVKTVSRKHFIIEVSAPADGEETRLYERTRCVVIDQTSKSGTTVNNILLKSSDEMKGRELTQADNTVKPGNSDEVLLIKWVPCTLSYHLLQKELKAGVLAVKQEKARRLGIKAVTDFVPGETTHVVATKRNTAKGLQALITGKYVVTDAFVEALELAATPNTLSQDENLCPLEEDFEENWPNEILYLPAPAKEPTTKPDEAYRPQPTRTHVFEHFVFVFGDEKQLETLMPVITTGHGKAIRFKVVNGQSTVDDLVTFMQNADGKKSGNSHARSDGGAILVRWKGAEPHADWTNHLIDQAALKLDQRAIDQSEFLDAILSNNAAQLRQAIPQESFVEGIRAPPPSFAAGRGQTQVQTNGHGSRSAEARHTRNTPSPSPQNPLSSESPPPTNHHVKRVAPVQPPTRESRSGRTSTAHFDTQPVAQQPAARRRSQPASDQVVAQEPEQPTAGSMAQSQDSAPQPDTFEAQVRKSRYLPPVAVKKFDDDFNADDVEDYEEEDDEEGSQVSIVDDSEAEDAAPEAIPASQPVQQTSRKRVREPSPERDMMDELLPAANAMKRQRRQWEEEAERTGRPLQTTTEPVAVAKPTKKKEIDPAELIRMARERAKEQNAEREGSQEPPESTYNPEERGPTHLAVVEHIELPVRKRIVRSGMNPEDDPRWDERWNGLKNFKKFRPQEKGLVRKSNHAGKVFVPLVALKAKTGGLGERYWEKTEEEKEHERRQKKKREKRKAQESLSQSQARSGQTINVSDDEEQPVDNVDGDEQHVSPELDRLQAEAASVLDHEIDVDSPRRTRGDDARETQSTKATASGTQSTRGTKRKTASIAAAPAPKKRQKTLPVTTIRDDEDEESDDENKFRWGGKGRGRRAKG
ncbi:uncharacterized protein AB675_3549 [Cyphellophora attinorum]|uniref:FHA domain-containing protein n=1 Tax=Cyphellophora attinorum TaxID=1664694 RepID=A0A0N1HAI5_9EURO|nr:uncharacterized protein AB675_3549 [Phialophora attinorum]KPI39675.1 hypothetical protein AB675_3549 [Phialophora attinorum]